MRESVREMAEFLGDRWVLVVEPALNYKNSIRSFLANLKVQNVRVVSSVQEARRECLTHKVGFFIVEWVLSETNGIQYCKEIRAQKKYANVPFLLTTVENLRSDVVVASETGIDAYLLKPFSYEDFTDTITSLVRAKLRPTELNSFLTLAQIKMAEGRTDDAKQLFHMAVAQDPGSARAVSGLARVALAKGDLNEAVRLFQQAIDLNQEYIEPYRELAEIFYEQGRTSDLHAICQRLHQLSPDNPKYALFLAQTYLEMGDAAKAEQFFKRSIRQSPRLAEAYKGLGKAYMIQEDYQAAMKAFRKALDLDVRDISVLNSLGLAYVKMGKYQEGIDRYRMALKVNPHDARILFNLGYAMEKVGNPTQAAFYYRQAVHHQPSFDKAKRRLAQLTPKADGKSAPTGADDDDDEVA